MSKKEFKTIDLKLHGDYCIKFREDSFVVSFGNAKKFYEADGLGAERYIEWLKAKIAKDPGLAVHFFLDGQIVGQIELGYLKDDPTCGYVNLYYLTPEVRGKGLGALLDEYVVNYFREQKIQKLRLSVSPTNTPAISFYKRMGWRDLGARKDHPEVNYMEKSILSYAL